MGSTMLKLLVYMVCKIFYVTNAKHDAVHESCMHLDHSVKDQDSHCGEVCNKSFAISYIHMPPYHDLFSIEKSMLQKCCGKCSKVSRVSWNRYLHDITELLDPIGKESPDFVFPVLGKSAAKKVLFG